MAVPVLPPNTHSKVERNQVLTGEYLPSVQHRIESKPIDTLLVNPKSARTHSKRQEKQIASSIRAFSYFNPIVIDENNVIIAGHGRLAAAKRLGMTEVPVIQIRHLDKAAKGALALAENRIAENAGWDREILAIELGELAAYLPDLGLEIGDLGFSTGEFDCLLSDHSNEDSKDPPDQFERATDQRIVTRRGDLWQLKSNKAHRVLCGDAQILDDIVQLCGTTNIAMVISDPPYNVRVNGHVGGRGKTKHQEFAFASGEMSDEQYRAFLRVCVGNMIAASRAGALLYLFIDWRHVHELLQVCKGLGLELRNICVWNKSAPGQGSFYRSAHELVVVCQIPGGTPINNIELGRYGRNRTNVWSFPGVNTFRIGRDDELSLHPTVKPIAMIAEAVKDASHRGDVVLDTFLGSGTALLACEKVGRVCYGLEYEPRYVDTAVRRWQEFTGRDAILIASADPPTQPFTTTTAASSNAPLIGLTFDEVSRIRSADAGVDSSSAEGATS